MSNNTFYKEIENEIKTALSDGLKKGDFSGLNRAISNSVDVVLDEATSRLEKGIPIDATYRKGTATYEKKVQIERERELRQMATGNSQETKKPGTREFLSPAVFNTKGTVASVLEMIFGGCGIAFNILIAMLSFSVGSDLLGFGIFSTLVAGGFGCMLGHGIKVNGLLSRAKRYADICKKNGYSTLSNIAASTGLSERSIRKDIKKLLVRGNFPQGHIDSKETTFMITDSVFHEYERSMENFRQIEEVKESSVTKEIATGGLTLDEQAELNTMISDGLDAIKRLHALNDDIPGEVISEKLQRLEDLLKQIFARIKEHPEQMGSMHKLMDYYLPTMLKLVEAYNEYDKVIVPGKEIVDAKNEIENTIDTINDAFVTLLNNLFQDSVWDITSDAKVLTTMLAQDGLSE